MARVNGYRITLKAFIIADTSNPEKLAEVAKAVSAARKDGDLSGLVNLKILSFDQKFTSVDPSSFPPEPVRAPVVEQTAEADTPEPAGTLGGAEIIGNDEPEADTATTHYEGGFFITYNEDAKVIESNIEGVTAGMSVSEADGFTFNMNEIEQPAEEVSDPAISNTAGDAPEASTGRKARAKA